MPPSGPAATHAFFSVASTWHEAELEPQPDPAEKASELRLLDQMLAKLSPKKRMVLVLFEIEGLGVNEIASVMDVLPTRSGPGCATPGRNSSGRRGG